MNTAKFTPKSRKRLNYIKELAQKRTGQFEYYKTLEHDFEKSNQKIIKILDSITDGFFTMDNNLKMTYMNKAAERVFVNPNIMMGKCIWDIEPRYIGSKLHQELLKAKSLNMAVNFEMCGENTGRWFEASVYPLHDGFSVYFRVITQRKQAEEELRISKEMFFKVFDASPNIISIKCMDNLRYIKINESFERIIGYPREEVLGRTVYDLKIWSEHGHYELLQLLQRQGSVRNMEIQFWKKSGDIGYGLLSVEVIEINGKKYLISITNDITKRKQMEKEIIRLDRLNMIGQMAAGIGHEVRNPMTTVRGFLQMLGDKEECVQYKEYYKIMIGELDRANSIITEYLSLARKGPENLTIHSLNNIIDSLYPLITADARNSNKDVFVIKEDISDIKLNEKEIRQLILNLVKNGIEASFPGGIITIRTFMDHNEVVLAVQDQGKGIQPDLIDNLGTPFLTTKPEGTGLGLATCYSIVSRHNAAINFDTSSSGTTFYVRFKQIVN